MRSPLTVRVSDGVRDQHVTRFVKNLRFTKTAPGGHHSASVSIDAPEGLFADLGAADKLFIYDGRNARTMWDGYVENPGRVTASGGARYDLSVMGGQVLASDNTRAVVFVSTDLSHNHWKRVGTVASASAGADSAAAPGVGPAIKAQFAPGVPVDTFSVVGMANTMFVDLKQPLHRIAATMVAGVPTVDYWAQIRAYASDLTTNTNLDSKAFSIAPTSMVANINPGDFSFAFGLSPAFVIKRMSGATNVTDDLVWSVFSSITMRPSLRNTAGAFTIATTDDAVYAHEVVAHLIGEGILTIDASTAIVSPTSFAIQNLAYLEGAKPRQILDDLALYEPDMLWEILEANAAGKHRFNYRAWPTTPRYEISGREFTESGGETDLCNRIAVSWKDATGAEQTTIRTTVVPALGSRVKDAEPITLPDGQGSEANAIRIGDETLAALNTPTRSGTAVIRQPILDRLTGLMAMPWEIEPGYLVRVRDIGADLRLTEMTYEDTNCTASLSLGTPTLTTPQRLARLRR